jgi:hypothetical protein
MHIADGNTSSTVNAALAIGGSWPISDGIQAMEATWIPQCSTLFAIW